MGISFKNTLNSVKTQITVMHQKFIYPQHNQIVGYLDFLMYRLINVRNNYLFFQQNTPKRST